MTPNALSETAAALERREGGSLARLMASDYLGMVEYYRTSRQLTPEEAASKAGEPASPDYAARIAQAPPNAISWGELGALASADPEAAHAAWGRLKSQAADELASGHRAAAALDPFSKPWDRAQFVAVRAAFIEEWQPRGGIELALIDTLTQAHTEWQGSLRLMHIRSTVEPQDEPGASRRWELPRVDETAAIEQAAAMSDRFNRVFVRTLRALRDLRRYSPQVVVQHAGQVNVAQQQVNLSGR